MGSQTLYYGFMSSIGLKVAKKGFIRILMFVLNEKYEIFSSFGKLKAINELWVEVNVFSLY